MVLVVGGMGSPPTDRTRMAVSDPRRRELARRAMLGTIAAGTGAIAGCLGDDTDDQPDDDVADDADDDTDPADDDAVDDADDTVMADDDDDDEDPPAVERYDVTGWFARGSGDGPLDSNHYPGGPSGWYGGHMNYRYLQQSFHDGEFYGQLVDDWSYEPGIIEYTLHDDFYWWDGSVFNAADVAMEMQFADYTWGGPELDAHDDVVTYEAVDEFTIRMHLIDAWNENWALLNTFYDGIPQRNRHFTESWLERYADAPDLDAIEEIRDEHDDYRIDAETNPDMLGTQMTGPFEFRFDGSVGAVGEDYWEMELVPEKNGNQRHFVENINFERVRFVYHQEADELEADWFLDGRQMFVPITRFGGEVPDVEFDVDTYTFHRDFDQWAFHFMWRDHPADNEHFRRAFAYFTDHTIWAQPTSSTPEIVGPFFSDERNERLISDHVLDAFTDYHFDETRWDDAEAEMLEGGFERNGNGMWMYQEDTPVSDAGDPIDFDMLGEGWMDYVLERGSDFFIDLEEFGLDLAYIADQPRLRDAESFRPVTAQYHGGGFPEVAYASVWGIDNLAWSSQNPHTPSVVEAPPMGEPAVAGDWNRADWIEYETRSMNDRLTVTVDEDSYQALIDRMAWCWNQLVPRFSPEAFAQVWMTNQYWQLSDMAENPRLWLQIPEDVQFYSGSLSYVGPDPAPWEE